MFPKIGGNIPPNHPFVRWGFRLFSPSILGETPYFWKHPYRYESLVKGPCNGFPLRRTSWVCNENSLGASDLLLRLQLDALQVGFFCTPVKPNSFKGHLFWGFVSHPIFEPACTDGFFQGLLGLKSTSNPKNPASLSHISHCLPLASGYCLYLAA